ncbi:MAG: periplasmic heavy metal sensor [Polyangiales bacterium]
MFGFVFGTLCLFGLFATLRRRRMWGHAYGWGGHGFGGHGWGSHGFGGHGFAPFAAYPPWARRRGRSAYWLRQIFEQMDTTPGQEKAIVKSIESFKEHMAVSRNELHDVRKQVAQALGGDVLDESVLSAALDRVEELIARTKLELTTALTEVHASLDGRQRKELAELISEGLVGRRFGYERF